MMTLSEAIAHAEWCARESDGECSDEHRQLAEWLRQLADEQRKVLVLMTEVNSLRAENDRLKTENEKLKAFVLDMYRTACGVYDERMQLESLGK